MTTKPEYISLSELVEQVNSHRGPWEDDVFKPSLEWKVNKFIWSAYDPDFIKNKGFIYPNLKEDWSAVLDRAIKNDSYDMLSKDEVLSILFGIHHKDRIAGVMWHGGFERGIIPKLLNRLLKIQDVQVNSALIEQSRY